MDLAIVSDADWAAVTVTVLEVAAGMFEPPAGAPVTVAVLTTEPASRSACVTACVAVQVVEAPGANVVDGHEMPDAFGSVIVIEPSVVWPVLRTTKEYGIEAPTAEYPVDVVDFTMVSEDESGAFVSVQVMSSPRVGVIAKGTALEPVAGSTVGDPDAVLTHETVSLYWLRTDVLPAAIDSLNVYANPGVAEATATTPVEAVTVAPEPAVVTLDPDGATPLGEIAIVNWSAATRREPLSALTSVSFVTDTQEMLSGRAAESVTVTPVTSDVPVLDGRSFTVAVFVMTAGQGADDAICCS